MLPIDIMQRQRSQQSQEQQTPTRGDGKQNKNNNQKKKKRKHSYDSVFSFGKLNQCSMRLAFIRSDRPTPELICKPTTTTATRAQLRSAETLYIFCCRPHLQCHFPILSGTIPSSSSSSSSGSTSLFYAHPFAHFLQHSQHG